MSTIIRVQPKILIPSGFIKDARNQIIGIRDESGGCYSADWLNRHIDGHKFPPHIADMLKEPYVLPQSNNSFNSIRTGIIQTDALYV